MRPRGSAPQIGHARPGHFNRMRECGPTSSICTAPPGRTSSWFTMPNSRRTPRPLPQHRDHQVTGTFEGARALYPYRTLGPTGQETGALRRLSSPVCRPQSVPCSGWFIDR